MTYPANVDSISSRRVADRFDGLPPHYAVHYHAGVVNHCPGCAGTQWFVGRTMAQCARCETALPLARVAETPMHPLFVTRGHGPMGACAA